MFSFTPKSFTRRKAVTKVGEDMPSAENALEQDPATPSTAATTPATASTKRTASRLDGRLDDAASPLDKQEEGDSTSPTDTPCKRNKVLFPDWVDPSPHSTPLLKRSDSFPPPSTSRRMTAWPMATHRRQHVRATHNHGSQDLSMDSSLTTVSSLEEDVATSLMEHENNPPPLPQVSCVLRPSPTSSTASPPFPFPQKRHRHRNAQRHCHSQDRQTHHYSAVIRDYDHAARFSTRKTRNSLPRRAAVSGRSLVWFLGLLGMTTVSLTAWTFQLFYLHQEQEPHVFLQHGMEDSHQPLSNLMRHAASKQTKTSSHRHSKKDDKKKVHNKKHRLTKETKKTSHRHEWHLEPLILPKGNIATSQSSGHNIGSPEENHVDRNIYHNTTTTVTMTEEGQHPRVVFLHASMARASPPRHRKVVQYPADFTDAAQLYSVLDSSDERIRSMELRQPLEDDECVPMHEWQTTFHPSCNDVHALRLDAIGGAKRSAEEDFTLFGTKGYWRNAWRADLFAGASEHAILRDTVVLKTLKTQHSFEEAHFEHDRVDAVAMERLTSSPHVINIFSFCGHSVMTEYADGPRLGNLADKSKKTPLARLRIARDIASGLADVHGIDGDDHNSFVHLDINPANVVSIGESLKLNDFNIGVLRRRNITSPSQQEPCGFPAQYPNPQWRSPEEAREETLTEKVDVFSMGHIFFRLICGHEPWNKLETGGKPSKAEVTDKVQRGVLPTIPHDILESTDPEVVAIRQAMFRCYTFDPKERPAAREIARFLQTALDGLRNKPNDSVTLQ